MRTETNPPHSSRWKALSAHFTLRNAAILLVAVFLLTGFQRLVGAWLIPSGSVQHQVERAIHDWAGLRVVSRGPSELSFWPSPRVTVEDVAIYPAGGGGRPALMTARKVTGTFSVLSALFGDPTFSNITLENPEFFIDRKADGQLNWQSGGRLADTAARADDGEKMLSSGHLGHFTINQGIVHFSNSGKDPASITGLDGDIDWKTITGSMSFDLKGMLDKSEIRLSGSSSDPGKLIVGKIGPVALNLKSDIADVHFNGTANIGAQPFLSGDFNASTDDASALGDRLGLQLPALKALKVVKIKAALSSEGAKYTLSDLSLNLTDKSATGILEMGWTKDKASPFLSGTLAFDSLDIAAVLDALMPLPPGLKDSRASAMLQTPGGFDLDLRISAGQAAYKAARIKDLAASARIKDGYASLALATGQFAGGTVSGELSLTGEVQKTYGLHLQAKDIDFSALPDLLSLTGPWPDARGTLTVDLNTLLPPWSEDRSETSGKISVTTGAGTLKGFDPAAFRDFSAKKQFFDLSAAGGGALAFDSFALNAQVENGVAELTNADFKSEQNLLNLRGIIPYKNNSVALTGVLSSSPAPDAQSVRFFAGGAWPNIVISPLAAFTGN